MKVHDLRHLAASLAFAEGASVKEVQAMLPHTRQQTTANVYVHIFESVRAGTTNRVDGVLRKIADA
jgi:integrase